MVAVPADATGHMEGNLVGKEEHGGNLVGDGFGGMEVAIVQEAEDVVLGGVVHVELVRADGVAFDADAEYLGFDGDVDFVPVVGLLKNAVEGVFQPCARCGAIGGGVF